MKHWKGFTAAALAQLGLVAGASASDLPPATINVVGNLGITTQSRQLEGPFWTEEIVEKSGGALTVNFRPWNEMGLRGPEVFELLGDGVMNIATAQLGHHTGSDPINDGNDLAGLSSDFGMFREVTDAFFPVLAEYYRENLGLHLLTMQSYQDQVLYCRAPISGLSDLEGRRVRSSGASQSDFLAHFGASGVDMAFGDVQPALEQGVIDCAITGTLGGYSARWYESASHLYTLPINFGAGATAANAEWWDSLDPALQEFLTAEVEAWSQRAWELNAGEDVIGVQCNTTGPCEMGAPGGMVLVEPSAEDTDLRREALLNAVLPGWINRCGDTCKDAFNTALADVTGLRIE